MKLRRILAAGALAALAAWPARAEEAPTPLPQPHTADSNAIGACLAADQVWLFVIDDEQKVLSNQCVGTPSSGEDALRLAGLPVQKARQGYLCTIGGHPDRCPATFEGVYWNYHHAAAGAPWSYSNVGAATHRPAPGTIEGWCYNQREEARCTPPPLRVVINGSVQLPPGVDEAALFDPEPLARPPLPPPPPIPWTTVASIAAVTALAGGAYLVSRRRNAVPSQDDDLGGR